MTVELFGPARALAGRATVDLDVGEPVDLARFLAALVRAVPAFAGEIVTADAAAFIAPNVLLLDGRRTAEAAFTSADRPCVLFVPSGG
jgi:hypothetical protein